MASDDVEKVMLRPKSNTNDSTTESVSINWNLERRFRAANKFILENYPPNAMDWYGNVERISPMAFVNPPCSLEEASGHFSEHRSQVEYLLEVTWPGR